MSPLGDEETVDVDRVKWVLVVEKEVHMAQRLTVAPTDPESGDLPFTHIFHSVGSARFSWHFNHRKTCSSI